MRRRRRAVSASAVSTSATTGGFVISISVVIHFAYVSMAQQPAQNTYISYTKQAGAIPIPTGQALGGALACILSTPRERTPSALRGQLGLSTVRTCPGNAGVGR